MTVRMEAGSELTLNRRRPSRVRNGWFQASSMPVPGCRATSPSRIARTVRAPVGSPAARYASRVVNRFDVVEPRTYITTAFACVWLKPCSSRRNATCSG